VTANNVNLSLFMCCYALRFFCLSPCNVNLFIWALLYTMFLLIFLN